MGACVCVKAQQYSHSLPNLMHFWLQVTSTNVDIARVAPKWHLYSPSEVEEVFARL